MAQQLDQLKKNKIARFIFSTCLIIASAWMQVYIIQVFMNPCDLLSSGFTGLSILLNKIANLMGIDFSVSLGILALNIPAALLCYKSVSHRFTFLSCLQFGLVSLFLQTFDFAPFFDDKMLNILFGGFLYGLSIVLALKADASTGGTDFIALYVSNKIHKSLWDYVFLFNATLIIIFGALFGWEAAGYSLVFQFISTKTISGFYDRYAQVTLEITTDDPETVSDAFIDHFRHGMTILKGQGAYSKKPYYVCKTVISTYEKRDAIDCIRSVKPDVLINVYKTHHFYGAFYQKPIE